MILAAEHELGSQQINMTDRSSPHAGKLAADYWYFGREREPLMHRIHAYPAKFTAFITQKAVDHARTRGVKDNRIAGVFCGCGTTSLNLSTFATSVTES